jgi:membrane peptidoglycan carboxypeptidase
MAKRKTASKPASALLFLAISVVVGILTAGMAAPVVGLAAAGTKAVATTMEDLPQDLVTPPQITASKIVLSDGSTPVATFADETREYVTIDKISPMMQYAQVAIEDHRFFEHGAVDPKGVIRAFLGNLTGSSSSGASTLTQQYVKLVRLQKATQSGDEAQMREVTEKTMTRKIIEMRYAMAVEEELSKKDILERYLNIAYYGDGAYGVQMAAKHYFGINASELNLEQSAMLAGLVQNPSATDPIYHKLAALTRRNLVLDRMNNADVKAALQGQFDVSFTDDDIKAARDSDYDSSNVINFQKGCAVSAYPFICDYVWRTIQSDKMSNLGATAQQRRTNFNTGGYTVTLTIDPTIQGNAQSQLSQRLDYRDDVIMAATVVEPATGKIRAMAQSRSVWGESAADHETQYNYNVDNKMGGAEGFQFGSTFKAFTLAAALQQGTSFSHTYSGRTPINLGTLDFTNCDNTKIPGLGGTLVKNAFNTQFGVIDLRTALRNSVNTYFMQLEAQVGLCNVVKAAEAAGVEAAMYFPSANPPETGTRLIADLHQDNIASFTLGSREVSPLTMASAYGTFANRGVRCEPTIIESMTGPQGETVAIPQSNCQQVMSAEVADGVNYGLTFPLSGSGSVARLGGGYSQAGKTGTANEDSVGAFVSYTPELSGAVVLSIDKTSAYYKSGHNNLYRYRSQFTGQTMGTSAYAAAAWKAIMAPALENLPKTKFDPYTPIQGDFENRTPTPTPTAEAEEPQQPAAPAEPQNQPAQPAEPGKTEGNG